MDDTGHNHFLHPLSSPQYRKLFAAQVVALVGTGLSTVALTLLAYDLAGDTAAAVLGTALAVKMLAYVFFSPAIAAMAQQFPRKSFLVTMDLFRAIIILMIPFVTEVWQIYVLIFLLNLFSAGFTPVFAATISDILPDECSYTRALSLSRLAYDLENLLSPMLAALALLFLSYSALFNFNGLAFLLSAYLVGLTALPAKQSMEKLGSKWDKISFGVRSYLKTPRLRGLLMLYVGVAAASAMLIVNSVIYIRQVLGGSESDVGFALAAAGAGSMIAALGLPRILEAIPDRQIMLAGGVVMSAGLMMIATSPQLSVVLMVWFTIGLGWSLVQTPAGRIVNRSSGPEDRPAYFSAQFALSHACWLIFYPLAGQLATYWGVETTAFTLSIVIVVSTLMAAVLWPNQDAVNLVHTHPETEHEHTHTHDDHHQHEHEGWEGPEPHSHKHHHAPLRHSHTFVIDDHHATWPGSSNP